MRIEDPAALANAFECLRGSISFVKLSNRICLETNGVLNLDPVWLQRVANGKAGQLRALDGPTEAALFGLCMMLNGLDQQQPPDRVVNWGKLLLLHILGRVEWAQVVYTEIEQRSKQITDIATLREFLRRCIATWIQ